MTLAPRVRPLLSIVALLALLSGACERGAILKRDTPHEAYASALTRAGLHETALGRDWLGAADAAVRDARTVTPPVKLTVPFEAASARAFGFRLDLKRGRVLRIQVAQTSDTPAQVFIDLFRLPPAGSDGVPERVASAPKGATTIEHEVRRDASFVVRIQPELLRSGSLEIAQETTAALRFPVSGRDTSAIQSYFLDPREGGRREHHGVDIFAPRGTPVLAASDGVVTSVATTPRGGHVVWVWDLHRRQSQYYAHLSSQAVQTGNRVSAGDVIGYVGNTGNARTTAPHLHFGIYAFGEGPIDPYPFVQNSERTLRRS